MQPPVHEVAIDNDIAEFKAHTRHGGWRLGLLVARSVEPGEGTGRPPKNDENRFGRIGFKKISAREFARRTGTTNKRVMAYLIAWDRAAADGLVPPSEDLEPGQSVDLPEDKDVPWAGENGYYRSYDSMYMDEDRKNAIIGEAAATGSTGSAAVKIASSPGSMRAAILADPATARAAEDAIVELRRRDSEAHAVLDDAPPAVPRPPAPAAGERVAEHVADRQREHGNPNEDLERHEAAMAFLEEAAKARLRIETLLATAKSGVPLTATQREAAEETFASIKNTCDFIVSSLGTGATDADAALARWTKS